MNPVKTRSILSRARIVGRNVPINLPLVIEAPVLAGALRFESVRLLNDLERTRF